MLNLVGAKAQSFYHSPNDTLFANSFLDQQVTMNITQVHTANDTLQFVWQKLLVDLPVGWEATICDNSNCNLALIDSDTTLPVLPGDDGLLLVHCTPHITQGIGIIQYTIYELHDPLNLDTLTWIIDASALSLDNKNQQEVFFQVKNHTLIWNGDDNSSVDLNVIGIDGRMVYAYSGTSKNEFLLNEISTGYYWVILLSKGKYFKQKIYVNENK